jgi:cytoskeleton protein RodZ
MIDSGDERLFGATAVGEFGDKFRKAREKKELSFDDVSNVTKIGARMLRAIEEENFDVLPGGVFNKGFIRAYAKHLGLNDEEAVSDYLACLRQAQIDAQQIWDPVPPNQPRPAAPDSLRPIKSTQPAAKSQSVAQADDLPDLQLPRAENARTPRKDFAFKLDRDIPWNILAIAAVVAVLGIILWIRHSRSANTAATNSPPASSSQSASAVTTASTQPASAPAALPDRPAPKSSQPAASAASTPSSTAKPARLVTSGDNNDPTDVTIRSTTKNPRPAAKADAPLTLVIRATETSWISISADGQPVSQETLIAPAHTSVRATHEIIAKVGNAAGVTFLWNGQEIPAQGAEAEVKTFIFDSTGMRLLPSSPATGQNP